MRENETDTAAGPADGVLAEDARGSGDETSGYHVPGNWNRSAGIDRSCDKRWTMAHRLRSPSGGSGRPAKYLPLPLPESRGCVDLANLASHANNPSNVSHPALEAGS